MTDLKNLDSSLWIFSTKSLYGHFNEENTCFITFLFKKSDQIGDVNCVPCSETIFIDFSYFGEWSSLNLFIKTFVFDRHSGYKTRNFEKASIMDKIYLKHFQTTVMGHKSQSIKFHLASLTDNFAFL